MPVRAQGRRRGAGAGSGPRLGSGEKRDPGSRGGRGDARRRLGARPRALARVHALGCDALQRLGDQLAAVVDSVERDEAAHARALAGAEQGLVKRLEPAAQALERVALADLEHLGLDVLGGRVGRELRQLRIEVAQGFGFHFGRRAALQLRHDEVARVIDREADQLVELGIGRGRGAGRVALDEAPRRFLVGDAGQADEVEQQPVGQRQRLPRAPCRRGCGAPGCRASARSAGRDNCRGTANSRRPRAG